MTRLETEAMHLRAMLAPPYTWHWWPQVKHRARELSVHPELAALPALMQEHYEQLKAESMKKPSSESSEKPETLPGQGAAILKLAPTTSRIGARKPNTGLPSSSLKVG